MESCGKYSVFMVGELRRIIVFYFHVIISNFSVFGVYSLVLFVILKAIARLEVALVCSPALHNPGRGKKRIRSSRASSRYIDNLMSV